nr:hypothetical protein Itr_chr12CG22510 [Ipomoea trifida]
MNKMMDLYERDLEARADNAPACSAAQATLQVPRAQPSRPVWPEEPGRSVTSHRPLARSRSGPEATHRLVLDRLSNRARPATMGQDVRSVPGEMLRVSLEIGRRRYDAVHESEDTIHSKSK